MALTRPGPILETTPSAPDEGSHCPPVPVPVPARVGDAGGGQVLAFPGAAVAPAVAAPAEVVPASRPGVAARARVVSGRWAAEAATTARAALDGSVWRSRPAALRDTHARVQRGEWAGDSAALLLAGQVYGYLALVLVALLYAAAEVVKRPLRLLVLALIVLVPLLATAL